VVFAVEERKKGNPIFEHWRKGDEFSPEQTDWLEAYWRGITSDSLRNYDRWSVLKQNETAKDKQAAAWRLVWIKQVRTWNKKERKQEPTGLWKSGSDDDKGFSQGDAPANGKAGGVKVEDTIRHTLGIVDPISPRPKTELLAELSRRSGMDIETVTERFNREWKNKSRNLFHHHGGGVWSTVHHKCAGKLKAEELSELKDRAQEQRRRGKQLTERQSQFWALFADLPKCEPNYQEPELCPMWQHVSADPARLEALQAIQANAASPKVRELPTAEYVQYLRENLSNFIRDDLHLPYFKDGRYRQGKLWYPVELFRNLKYCTAEEFRRICEREKFSTEDFTTVVNRAVANGDVVVTDTYKNIGYGYRTKDGKAIEGAQVIADREAAERSAREEKERRVAQMQLEAQEKRERQEAEAKRKSEEAVEAAARPYQEAETLFRKYFEYADCGESGSRITGKVVVEMVKRKMSRDELLASLLPFSEKLAPRAIEAMEKYGLAWWKEETAAA
jgi:hypothetical protein